LSRHPLERTRHWREGSRRPSAITLLMIKPHILPLEELALVSSIPTDNENTSHPPATGSDDCKQRAIQLLDGIRERFEG
jgi:hypothetical protein